MAGMSGYTASSLSRVALTVLGLLIADNVPKDSEDKRDIGMSASDMGQG